ncbi:MAG: chorismate--pyruvate lyase family protein [Alishewanella aestuarii]|uniref:Probable chorismate pyruvate-lyase n=1 Tax=Alishewanella aestuarii B11 TaxID=1197174 RepID=J2IHN6_9ALTE|nr:chorismate lyase [Alishewanella aestuarii]EJI86299.1 chorismate pyruvate lyase UbiC [Alishewanella aestuarii B11]
MTAVFSLAACAEPWQQADASKAPATLLPWLLEPASLTARLKAHCQQFRLQLLAEQSLPLPQTLQSLLPASSLCTRREVLMWCDQQAAVYAQSWIPQSSQQRLQQLAALGEQPLGELLFQYPDLQRSPIEIARLSLPRPSAEIAAGEYWARRSVFSVAGAPLLVAEVFLPVVETL